jgi:metal-responsive CopG/Arc/MetJ family transcriptional regulator
MATTKVTFTLDADTIARLNSAAERVGKPKSEVVREAIDQYHQRIGKLSESERQRMLRALDELAKRPHTRTQQEMEAELKEIRWARRHGGRRHPY